MVTGPLLRLEGVQQVFANGTVALRGVDLTVAPGSVHGLVGANGAGKSTLIKVLAGALQPSAGTVQWHNERVEWRSPGEALAAGVATIYQHIPLVPTLSVLENVFLARRARWRRSRDLPADFARLVERIGYPLDPSALVGELPIGQRQMVAILQSLAAGADLVVMDEPTASLAAQERDVVFEVVRRLSGEGGTTFLYVSHFLDEILDLTDQVTVLRDGRVVDSAPTADVDEGRLVRAIVGKELLAVESLSAPVVGEAPALLEARDLRSPAGVDGVSLTVRRGEVLGIAGLLGSGRSELLHALFGADRRATGTVTVAGRRLAAGTPAAVKAGLALVPEDRAAQGLIGAFSLWRNVSLPDVARLSRWSVLPRVDRERARARAAITALGIRAPGPDAAVGELSGGNAQKVVFAKWLYGRTEVFLLDEPTAGIDVGAKADLLELVRGFAADGKAVVVVSSEFEELLAVATRIVVLRQGRVVAERRAQETSESELILLASGLGGAGHA